MPTYEWIATKFQYEHLADLLNKRGKIDAKTASNYIGLLLTGETLSIQDRVLCRKKTLSEKIVIKTYLNHEFIEKDNDLKDSYKWLDQIRVQLTAKMLQSNSSTIANKINNPELNSEAKEKLAKAKHSLKALLRTIKKVVKQFNANATEVQIIELSNAIAEYMICKLNLTRYDIIGKLKSLNQVTYNQLVFNSRNYHNSLDGH